MDGFRLCIEWPEQARVRAAACRCRADRGRGDWPEAIPSSDSGRVVPVLPYGRKAGREAWLNMARFVRPLEVPQYAAAKCMETIDVGKSQWSKSRRSGDRWS